jgi:hypothetical protein
MDNPWYLLRDTLIAVADALIILGGHKLFTWGRDALKIKDDPFAHWVGEVLGLTMLIGGVAYFILYFVFFLMGHFDQLLKR